MPFAEGEVFHISILYIKMHILELCLHLRGESPTEPDISTMLANIRHISECRTRYTMPTPPPARHSAGSNEATSSRTPRHALWCRISGVDMFLGFLRDKGT